MTSNNLRERKSFLYFIVLLANSLLRPQIKFKAIGRRFYCIFSRPRRLRGWTKNFRYNYFLPQCLYILNVFSWNNNEFVIKMYNLMARRFWKVKWNVNMMGGWLVESWSPSRVTYEPSPWDLLRGIIHHSRTRIQLSDTIWCFMTFTLLLIDILSYLPPQICFC